MEVRLMKQKIADSIKGYRVGEVRHIDWKILFATAPFVGMKDSEYTALLEDTLSNSCFGVLFHEDSIDCLGAPNEAKCRDFSLCQSVFEFINHSLQNVVTVPEEVTTPLPKPVEAPKVVAKTVSFKKTAIALLEDIIPLFSSNISISTITPKTVKVFVDDSEAMTLNARGIKLKYDITPSELGLDIEPDQLVYKHSQLFLASTKFTDDVELLKSVLYRYFQVVAHAGSSPVEEVAPVIEEPVEVIKKVDKTHTHIVQEVSVVTTKSSITYNDVLGFLRDRDIYSIQKSATDPTQYVALMEVSFG